MKIDGPLLVEQKIYRDDRGFFLERFQEQRFAELGMPTRFVQDNHSRSVPGVLRGLHFQSNPSQGKLVGVVRGRIFDVVVDIRPESPTFGKWVSIELSDSLPYQLWIPGGFAHGFCVLGDEPADVVYKTDTFYNPKLEGGFRWNDEDLAIDWPLRQPKVSQRDSEMGFFRDYRRSVK